MHILIIEGTPDLRRDIRRMLLRGSDRRYRYTEVQLGAAGVRACRAAADDSLPDCVLLGYHLPDMDALEVLAQIRNQFDLPPCPVVVLTGSNGRRGKSVLSAGAQEYIEKSRLTPESLTRVIEDAIERFNLISERSRAERKLRESEERIQLAAQISGIGIYDYDVATDTCNWSPELFALTGVPEGTVIRRETVTSLMHPEDRDRFRRAMQAALDPRGTGAFTDEFRLLRADSGDVRWHHNRGQTMFDSSNGERSSVRHTGVVIDVTDRKRAENASRESEAKAKARADELSTVMEAVPVITFLAHDPLCRSMSCSRATRQFLRLPEEASPSKSAPDGEKPTHFRVTKDGRELTPEELPVQIAASTGRDVRDVSLTIMFNDGTARDLFGDAVPLFDESGKVRGAVGAFTDITDRQRAEAELHLAHHQLKGVLNSINDGLAVLDKNWRYTYFSEQGALIIGTRPEQLLGGCIWELFPHAQGTRFYEGYHRAVETGQPVHFEEYYPEPLNKWLECHCYPSGEGLAVYFRDVTDRKRAEEARQEIAESYERQSRVFDATLSAITDFAYIFDL